MTGGGPFQHPSHFVIEQLGMTLQTQDQQIAALRAEVQRLQAALAAATTPAEPEGHE